MPVRALLALLAGAALTLAPRPAAAQSAADSAAIRATALDYIEGWYTADAARMERALHPDLAKRLMARDPASGRSRLQHMGALELVQRTRRGGGSETPVAERRTDVRILDIFDGRVASVRVDADGWIDYMHLAQAEGRWVIVNVLWEVRRRPPPAGSH